MARIRSIKPEFPQSETVGRLSRDARLLFIQIWTIVDDAGRARAASRMLASLLFPYDDDAPSLIDGWLDELEREGCIRRYVVNGSAYLDCPNWLKHQKIDKPSGSKIPAFDEGSANPREVSTKPREVSLPRGRAPDLGPRIKDQDQDLEVERECEGERSEPAGSAHQGLLAPVATAKPKPKPRAAEIPEDYRPADEDLDWLRGEVKDRAGYDLPWARHETRKFVDHHRAHGNTFKRPSLAWRKWMRTALERPRNGPLPRGSPADQPAFRV